MNEEFDENKKQEKIEIVNGKSKDLDISEVRDNLTFEVQKNNPKENGDIVIPEVHNNTNENKQ